MQRLRNHALKGQFRGLRSAGAAEMRQCGWRQGTGRCLMGKVGRARPAREPWEKYKISFKE